MRAERQFSKASVLEKTVLAMVKIKAIHMRKLKPPKM